MFWAAAKPIFEYRERFSCLIYQLCSFSILMFTFLTFTRSAQLLKPVSISANSAARPSDGLYQGMRSSKSKLKASVYWWTRSQFWKVNQAQHFCDQNERKPIRLLRFNARACDRTGSRDQNRWSGNWPLFCRTIIKGKLKGARAIFPP